jgi:CheY-like chemotaxis protein
MGKKILLADDSITIQKVVELTFSDSDFDVISVGNGEQALRKAHELKPDIALLDVIMPEKNGYEVCQLFKQDPELRRMPVLLLTGTFESFDRGRAEAAGADGYLTKPFESQMLISKVEELLASAPRHVVPSERAGRMEVVTEGRIMTVDAPRPPEPKREAAAAAEGPPPAAAPDAAWEEEQTESDEPRAQEVSFPERPVEAAPEARAAFREWAAGDDEAGEEAPLEPPPAAPAFEEDEGSGPPAAALPRGDEAGHAGDTATSPLAAAAAYPDRPLAPDTYEQTFDMQEGAEPVPLAAPPPRPDPPEPGTLYSGPDPAAAPAPGAGALSPELIEQIARRVVEKLSDQVIREVAWEVIPDLAELLIRQRIGELERGGQPRG